MVVNLANANADPALFVHVVVGAFGFGFVIVAVMVAGFLLDRNRRPPRGPDEPP